MLISTLHIYTIMYVIGMIKSIKYNKIHIKTGIDKIMYIIINTYIYRVYLNI